MPWLEDFFLLCLLCKKFCCCGRYNYELCSFSVSNFVEYDKQYCKMVIFKGLTTNDWSCFFHESGNTKLLTFPIFLIISPDPLIACNYSKPKKNTSWIRFKSKSPHTIIFCVGLVHIFELFLITGQSQRQGNKNTI